MLEIFLEYGLFLLKVITVLISVITNIFVAASKKVIPRRVLRLKILMRSIKDYVTVE